MQYYLWCVALLDVQSAIIWRLDLRGGGAQSLQHRACTTSTASAASSATHRRKRRGIGWHVAESHTGEISALFAASGAAARHGGVSAAAAAASAIAKHRKLPKCRINNGGKKASPASRHQSAAGEISLLSGAVAAI